MSQPLAVEQRLTDLRGGAALRSPNVRTLAAFAEHTDCRLATLAFSAGVDLDRLLVKTQFEAPFGQSPFAFQRGVVFEKRLRDRSYEPTLNLLRTALGDPLLNPRVVDLRSRHPKNRAGLQLRAKDTRGLLRQIISGDPKSPHLIDGAVLQAQVGGVDAYFEADALAAVAGGKIRVAEVKSFPKVDGRADADKLGAALDQVALYILLVRWEIARLGGDPDQLVSDLGLVITPVNVGLQPTLSAKAVGPRVDRANRILAVVPEVSTLLRSVPSGLSFGPVADPALPESSRLQSLTVLADTVGTAYKPGCLAQCGNALFCRDRAVCTSSPSVMGSAAQRLLPGISTLDRAADLSRGATPTSTEVPVATLLSRAGDLYDELTGTAQYPATVLPQSTATEA